MFLVCVRMWANLKLKTSSYQQSKNMYVLSNDKTVLEARGDFHVTLSFNFYIPFSPVLNLHSPRGGDLAGPTFIWRSVLSMSRLCTNDWVLHSPSADTFSHVTKLNSSVTFFTECVISICKSSESFCKVNNIITAPLFLMRSWLLLKISGTQRCTCCSKQG